MKKFIVITVMATLINPLAVLAAGESVDETRDAKASGTVHVNVTRGEVDFRTWEKSAVRVVGTLDEKTEEFIFEVNGADTRVQVKVRDREFSWLDDDGSDLTIYLPEKSQVEFTGVSTDVDVRGVSGEVEIGLVSGDVYLETKSDRVNVRTVSGDVELREGKGRIRIKTVSGDVEAYDVTGDVSYTSVSGDISIREGGEEVRVESVSGDIDVRHDSMTAVAGHSVSGDVDIAGILNRNGMVEFDTMSGSIRLLLGGELDASFDIETGSGSIRNRISDDKPRVSKFVGEETLRFSVGDGNGHVILTTQSGDIAIGRR